MPREAVRGEREHSMVVPIGGRTGDVVEPMLKPHCFMNTSKVAELACIAVTDKDLVIDPEEYKAVWLQFLGEDRQAGWCVQADLVQWGHQVSAYHCTATSEEEQCWVAAMSEEGG